MGDFAVIPKATETDAEESIRVLKEQKYIFIYLYIYAPELEPPFCMYGIQSASATVTIFTLGSSTKSPPSTSFHVRERQSSSAQPPST
jgi:hypothetical protein